MIDGPCIRSAAAGDPPRVAQIHWESGLATYRGVFPQQMFDAFPLAQREALWAREAARHTPPLRENCYRAATH